MKLMFNVNMYEDATSYYECSMPVFDDEFTDFADAAVDVQRTVKELRATGKSAVIVVTAIDINEWGAREEITKWVYMVKTDQDEFWNDCVKPL